MKYLLLLTAFLAVIASSSAQENPDCGWYGTKTVAERNAMFPFNKAKKVVLVSYPDRMDTLARAGDKRPLTERMQILDTINFKRGEFRECTYYIIERAELNQGWINFFSHLLVNYTVKQEPQDGYGAALCYQPRNSILFYDENGSIICCYEICFECGHGGIWPDPDKLYNSYVVNNCAEPYKQLKFIFSENGITYGIDEK